jgi:hypothetical protein
MGGSIAEVQALATIVNAIGTVGLLLFMLVLFYSGKVLPRTVHDEIIKHYARLVEVFTARLDTLLEQQKRIADMIAQHDKASEQRDVEALKRQQAEADRDEGRTYSRTRKRAP